MAAPDFVAFKETPDAEKPVPPCGHCDKKQIINDAETLEESRWYTMMQKHRSILIEKFV